MIDLQISTESVMGHLSAMPDAVRSELVAEVTAIAIDLQGLVQDKLAGVVLNERTHRLHDSIHYEVPQSDSRVVGIVGTDVEYAAFWEYGFSGEEQIREHLRSMTMAFGKPVETPRDILVRAHTRHVDQSARSYLRSTLAEQSGDITQRLQAAVQRGLNA